MTAVAWLLLAFGAAWCGVRALAWGYLAAAALFIGWWCHRTS